MSFCLYNTSMIAFSLMNVSMRNFFLHILTKKRMSQLFPFFINILLFCCVFIVSWIGKLDDLFVVHIFISFLNWFIRNAWVYWETHFNNFSNQRISSEDNSVPEEQFESLLQRNHPLVHLSDSRGQAPSYSQLISRYCRPSETSRVCCSSFPPSNSPAA